MFEYRYKLVGFQPNPENEFARWHFRVELDCAYGASLARRTPQPDALTRLRAECNKIVVDIYNEWGEHAALRPTQRPGGRECRLGFWGNTCLLTNLTVPGNACGLDMEPDDFTRATWNGGGTANGQRPLRYLPHNIDGLVQATALVAVWTYWYDHAAALTD